MGPVLFGIAVEVMLSEKLQSFYLVYWAFVLVTSFTVFVFSSMHMS